MISIKIDWQGKKGLENLIRYIESDTIISNLKEQVIALGQDTADNMKETINTERKNPARPDHKLENVITSEILNTTDGVEVGIGNIAKLKVEAPHFELIDVGGTYITKKTHPVPLSYFADINQVYSWKTAAEGGKLTSGFVTFKEGSSHTITGIDYVGKAIRNLDKELKIMIEKLGAKFVGDAEKESQG